MRRYIGPWASTDPSRPDLHPNDNLTVREFEDDEAAVLWLMRERVELLRGAKIIIIDVTDVDKPDVRMWDQGRFRVVGVYQF